MRIDEGNAMVLRPAFDKVEFHIFDYSEYETLYSFDRDHIISLSMSLRSVETKMDNPELQASSFEVKLYFEGDHSDFEAMQAVCRNADPIFIIALGYVADGYERDFYSDLSEDNFYLEDHVLTIKGMDAVGFFMNKTYFGSLIEDYYMYDATHYDTQNMIAQYLKILFRTYRPMDTFTYRNFRGGPSIIVHEDDYENGIYGREISDRSAVAQMVNIFRGSNPANPDSNTKRLVFRDAGIPQIRWGATAIAGSTIWPLNYGDLSDFVVIYDAPIKSVTIDNPCPKKSSARVVGTITLNANERTFYDSPVPLDRSSVIAKIVDGTTRASVEILSATTYILTASISGEYEIKANEILSTYESGETPPCIKINTGNMYGKEIELDDFIGLKHFNNTYMIKNALQRDLNDCNLKNPRWIEFTWRGNPKMQPRDIILLTEQDGSKNYYEIDYLTLDMEKGGLTSHVKAIYKCAYTEA